MGLSGTGDNGSRPQFLRYGRQRWTSLRLGRARLTAVRACADRSVHGAHAARVGRAEYAAPARGSMTAHIGRSRRSPSGSCTDRQSSGRRDRNRSGRDRPSTARDSRSRCSSRRTAGSPRPSRIALGHREHTCTGSATSGGRGYTGRCRRTAAAGYRECTCTCAVTSGTRECRGHFRRTVVAGYRPAACRRRPEGCRCRSSRCSRPGRSGRRWVRTERYSAGSEPRSCVGKPAEMGSACRSYGSRAGAPRATCACLRSPLSLRHSMPRRRLGPPTTTLPPRTARELSRCLPPEVLSFSYLLLGRLTQQLLLVGGRAYAGRVGVKRQGMRLMP
jgi:hypothetical protein